MRRFLLTTTIATLLSLPVVIADADTLIWISDGSQNIGQVDIQAQNVVAGSVHNTGLSITDIAFDSAGQMYGTTFTDLYRINDANGAATHVAAYSGVGAGGMNALVGNGTTTSLFGAAFNQQGVYIINTATAGTTVGAANAGQFSAGDFAYMGNTLYSSTGTLGNPDHLINVTTNTDVGTFHVGSISGATVDTLYGLADDGTTMYAVSGSEIYSVDLADAVLTPLFDYTQHENGQDLTGAAGGAAYFGEGVGVVNPLGTAVPEPASLGILGLGVLGLVAARRRR